MNKKLILITCVFWNAIFISCISVKPTSYSIFSNSEININDSNMESSKFDESLFHKYYPSDFTDTLSDGSYIEYILMSTGPAKWIYPAHKFYCIYEEFNEDFILIKRGYCLGRMDIGKWEYYDMQGNKTIVDEDEKFGNPKFTYNHLILFIEKKGYVNTKTGEGREKIKSLGFNKEKKAWVIYVEEEVDLWKLFIINSNNGSVIKSALYRPDEIPY